ncbi:hypothetical protein BJF85_11050 [Saccharomonospora sp. CUA-673]|uniref:MerR family transcriptional regulator n=1 Tax=Saccharomonospora sp. CUA-673 TaxID=1904969 RepID=UPI00095AE83E|nr:MerR family DNA-binding transcriptional regulator [Saccharomonospora sp. CUA-673]OLT48976.1 hypothetical protein BJF85_11050 [Saccharomonospora sp. CUA-673]
MTVTSPTVTRPAPTGEHLSVSEVAEVAGIAPSAVRFYEKHGVIKAVRTPGNQRRFDDSAGCRVQVAKLAQRVGLTIKEIAALFDGLPPNPSPDHWDRIANRLVTEAQQRVEELKSHLEVLGSDALLCEAGATLDSDS